jgi:protoporphyrinogen oxidase
MMHAAASRQQGYQCSGGYRRGGLSSVHVVGGDAPIVILGGGLTGLSAALHLVEGASTRDVIVLERGREVGGKACSERHRGFTFDVTGHWLHLRDPGVQALVQRLFRPGELVEIERRTSVYTHGLMLPYPFQANIFGLPLPVVQECLVGFIEAQRRAAAPDVVAPRTFEEFSIARFGEGIARHFFVPYNKKLWGEHYERLTPAWVSRFVPMPDVEQVVGGAIGLRQEGLGYNVRFLYPARGGIDALPGAMRSAIGDRAEVRLDAEVAGVDADRRVVHLRDGSAIEYSVLVSTMPLPELAHGLTQAPASVRDAASRLRWVRWRYLNLATRRAPPMGDHWVYVPEPEIPFFRVGVFSNALPAMAPPGAGSLYVELEDREGAPDLPRIYAALTEMGALHDPSDVEFAQLRDIEYAYVVFDEDYEDARGTLLAHLDRVGIRSCGRYGSWVYNSMEDSIIQGMEAAQWATQSR